MSRFFEHLEQCKTKKHCYSYKWLNTRVKVNINEISIVGEKNKLKYVNNK